MKLLRKLGSTAQILQLFIQNSASNTGAGLTGLAFNTSSLTAFFHRDTDTTATNVALVGMTVGTFNSSGFAEINSVNMPGWYQFCPTNAALASGATSVAFHLQGATNMAPLPFEIDLDGQVDVTSWNGTAVKAPTTAGVPEVCLTDAVAHGGTLGSSTATLALSRANLTSQTANTTALTVLGNGTGSGAAFTSGSGATGDGIKSLAASSNGNGFSLLGTGTGNGLLATGGNGTSGDGIHAAGGSGDSHGLRVLGGTTSGNGIYALGSSVGNGHGIHASGNGTGSGINAGSGVGATGDGITATSFATNGNGISGLGVGSGSGLLLTKGSTGNGFATDTFSVSSTTTFTGAITGTNASNDLRINGVVPGASGGLFIAGTNSPTTVTTSFTTTFTGNLTGSVGSVTGLTPATIATATWQDATAGDFTTANSIGKSIYNAFTANTSNYTVAALANAPTGGSAPTVSQIATAVWQDATGSDFTASNSIGKSIYNAFTSNTSNYTVAALANAPTGGSAPTVSQIATAVWQDTTAGDFTTAGSIGKSLFTSGNVPGAASGIAIVGSNVGTATSVSGAVGSVTGNVGGNVVGSVASVSGNVGGNVVGTVASVVGNVGGNVTGSAGSVVGAVGSVTGAVGSVTGAVGSVTGNVGGNVTGSVGSVTGLTTATIASAVLGTAMTESYNADGSTATLAQAAYVIMQMMTEITFAGTTATVKKLDGTTTAYTLTINDASTPTSITRST